VDTYYPNKKDHLSVEDKGSVIYTLKKIIEWMLANRLGDYLDAWLFRVMLKRRERKFGSMNKQEFDLHMRTRKNVSKHHEKGHQSSILEKYRQRIRDFENRHGVTLHHG
jgi:hypothetical protein